MKSLCNALVRTTLILGAIIAFLGPPAESFACSYDIGLDDIIVPWTTNYAADCSVQGYGVNWIGIASLALISVVSAFVVKRSIKNRTKLSS